MFSSSQDRARGDDDRRSGSSGLAAILADDYTRPPLARRLAPVESLRFLSRRFEAMPRPLKLIAAASIFVGAAVAAQPFVPGSHFDMAGYRLSQAEVWDTRVAFASLVVGLLMLLVGVGIVSGRRWVRPVLVFLPMFQTFPYWTVHRLYGAPAPIYSASVWATMSAIWAVAMWAYLFRAAGPRRHFASTGAG